MDAEWTVGHRRIPPGAGRPVRTQAIQAEAGPPDYRYTLDHLALTYR